METVNVLTQMAEYDFNAPINVEMIFEDSDDNDDAPFQNEHSDQESIKDKNNNKEVAVEENETQNNCTISENQIIYEGLNKSMLSLKPNEEIIEDIAVNNLNNFPNNEIGENSNDVRLTKHNQSMPDGNQHATILISDDTVHNSGRVPVARPLNDHYSPATMFIEDLLNKLSEHIVLIIKAFYYYGAKTNEDSQKKEAIFNFIKSHFFELSFTTVESIILPQEQNETFINQFLDNTVLLANSKSLKWRCQRRTVIPFFKELMTWAKQKREFIRNNNRPCPTENLPNNLCIFSSGNPGNEISINIDANTFIKISDKQNYGTVAQNANHNKPPNYEPTRGKTPAASPRYGNRVKDIQKKNPQYHRGPRPPYSYHNFKNISNRPQQYTQTNVNNYNQMNVNGTYYNNMGQIHQNHQQPNPSYPTQVHYINTNQTTPPAHNDHLNYLNNLVFNNNTNPNTQHGTQMENQATFSPVITSVSSLNPNQFRCCMCGKSTSTPCEPYAYSPSTPIYCSYLCQYVALVNSLSVQVNMSMVSAIALRVRSARVNDARPSRLVRPLGTTSSCGLRRRSTYLSAIGTASSSD